MLSLLYNVLFKSNTTRQDDFHCYNQLVPKLDTSHLPFFRFFFFKSNNEYFPSITFFLLTPVIWSLARFEFLVASRIIFDSVFDSLGTLVERHHQSP